MKKKIIQNQNFLIVLPSALTIINLCLGFLSLLASVHGHFFTAAWLIILAAIVDGFDGVIARLFRTNSLFGIELDSLADAVSFASATSLLFTLWSAKELGKISAVLSFIFLSAGILRLARYNVLQAKHKNRSFYVGLTVPSASLFIAALIIAFSEPPIHLMSKLFLILVIPLISSLMVSRIHYPNFIYLIYRHRINFLQILLTAIIMISFYLYPSLTLLILASINVSSGPLREAWRLTQKLILARNKSNEFPWS